MGLLERLAGSLWRRDRVAQDLSDEIAFHVEERTRENLAAGMAPDAAAADARRRFGNVPLLQERARDLDVVAWLDAAVRDAGQALRSLRRRPGLVLTAVLTLALGIGATSAIYSIVHAVLLRPLPIPGHAAVVMLREARAGSTIGGNPARFRDWQRELTGVRDLAGFYGEATVLTGRGEPERYALLRTFGPVLGLTRAELAMGRGFTPEEERGEGAPVALLSHGLWQRRFGGEAGIVGQAVTLSATSYTIAGVLAAGARYPDGQDFVSPAPRGFQEDGRGGGNYFTIIGRLAEGTTLAAANAEAAAIARRFRERYPDTDAALTATLAPLQEVETAETRAPLLLLLGAVFLVLLIACVNIASLLLARAAERRHEAAIRVALGAGRGSLLRLYLMESGWLALAGGLGGLLVAWLGLPVLVRVLPAELPRLAEASLDWRVALFAAGVAVGCGLLFGLAPAWQAARAERTHDALRDGGRGTTGGRPRARRALVVVQVALSMVLLVSAGLLARSLYQMRGVTTGVVPGQVLVLQLAFPWDTDAARLHGFYRQALEDLAALPGVRRVGLADRLPLEGGTQSRPIRLGEPAAARVPLPAEESIAYRAVSEGYFATVGVPLLAGRMWRDDDAGRVLEVVVNQEFARRYLPEARAVGSHISFGVSPADGAPPAWHEVVGVVGDLRVELNQSAQPPEVFLSYRSTYWPLASLTLLTRGDPAALTAAVRAVVRRIDPDLIIDGLIPLERQLARASAASRVRTWLVGVFALAALLLAALGLYGVLSSEVAQRRHEIGLRMALGAEPRQVLGMTVRQGLLVTVAGLLAGGAGALAAGRLLATSLFGVGASDPLAFGAAALVLLLVALAASYLPARRASRVDPMVALRRE
ncbi:MAG: ABC transporter permease [Gemmatimonadetes bacterium]|nr:ABC transporter permease [Gemmatimonadota bacterium]